MAVDYLEDQNKEGWLGKVKMPYVPSAAAAPVAPVAVAPVITPTAPVKPQVLTLGQIAAQTAGTTKEAEETAKDTAQAYAGFMQSTNPYANADRERNADRIVQIVKETPEGFGLLTDPGALNAFFTVIDAGISAAAGDAAKLNFSSSGLQDALSKIKTDAKGNLLSDQVQKNRNEAAQLFARGELDYAKIAMKGQGAVSDLERALLARASGSTRDNPELIIKRQMAMSELAKSEAAAGKLFREMYPKGDVAAYGKFRNSDAYQSLVKTFNDKADAIIKMDIKLPKSSGAAAAPPAKPPTYADPAKEAAFEAYKKANPK
jgi:hypothetical protein